MKRVTVVTVLPCLIWFIFVTGSADAASRTGTYTGGGWTLTLTFRRATYGQAMSGTFRSAHQTFTVEGDWIPAADEGSDLLRFYGRPFGPKSPLGLVGLATLANTCSPSCVASTHYKLVETSVSPQISTKLPGVGKPSLVLQLHT